MWPMVSRKIIKGQEFFSIFLKALGDLGILEFIGFSRESKFVPVWRSKSVPLGLKNRFLSASLKGSRVI